MLSHFSHVRLFATLWTGGPSVHGILQARILEWVAISSSGGSSHPGTEATSFRSPALAGGFFTTSTTWEAWEAYTHTHTHTHTQGFPGGSDGKEAACNAGDLGLIPGSGRSLGEGNGNSF